MSYKVAFWIVIVILFGYVFLSNIPSAKAMEVGEVATTTPEVKNRDLADLEISVLKKQRTLKIVCDYEYKRITLNGCFKKADDKVYLRSDMDQTEFMMVFYHEVGHFYTENYKLAELRPIFRTPRDPGRENAAEDFALWMTTPFLLSKEKIAFFESLGVDKEKVNALLMENWIPERPPYERRERRDR